MTKDLIHLQILYTEWANRQLLDACRELTPEQFHRELGGSFPSIALNLRHILYAERSWTRRLVLSALPLFDWLGDPRSDPGPPLEASLEAFDRHWPPVWASAREWIEGLSDADLDFQLSATRADGTDFLVSRWRIALHMVNHSTMHRGQVMNMLRALGQPVPSTDLSTYYILESEGHL
jgi:uncharacterized damage-inducible protein DinB